MKYYHAFLYYEPQIYFYLLPPPPLPRPLPLPIAPPAEEAAVVVVVALILSSTRRASKLSESGKIHARIVFPRIDSVAYETGFFPLL